MTTNDYVRHNQVGVARHYRFDEKETVTIEGVSESYIQNALSIEFTSGPLISIGDVLWFNDKSYYVKELFEPELNNHNLTVKIRVEYQIKDIVDESTFAATQFQQLINNRIGPFNDKWKTFPDALREKLLLKCEKMNQTAIDDFASKQLQQSFPNNDTNTHQFCIWATGGIVRGLELSNRINIMYNKLPETERRWTLIKKLSFL